MTASDLVEWRRVVVVDGRARREVLLSSTDAVRTSLRREGLDLDERRVIVLTADGSEIDVESPPTLSDGALLTVVDISAVGRATDSPPRGAVHRTNEFATAVWLAVAGLSIAAAAAGALGLAPGAGVTDGTTTVVRGAGIILFAILAGVCATLMAPGAGRMSLGILVAPGALAFAAGFLAVPTQLADAAHLGGFVALLAAAIAQAGVHARFASTNMGGATGLTALALAVLAALWGVTLLAGVGAPVAAALAAGFAPVALRVLPFLVLDVPEGQLLEYAAFKQNRWTVRETTPPPSHPVTSAQLVSTMERARSQFRSGTVVFSLVPAAVLPLLLLDPTVDPVARIARIVLCGVIVVSLMLSPRQANGSVQRWTPRVGAAIVALEFAWVSAAGQPPVGVLVAGGVIAFVGAAVAASSVPIQRGARSLGISRFADVLESLATAVAFPAAFAAAGLIDVLRGTVA